MSLDVLNLLLVLLAALGGGLVATRLGYPAILGELAAGILLGPPLLGLLELDDGLAVVGKLGVVLLMLYIGLHLDPNDIGRASKAGALAALGGFLVPAGLGFGLMILVTQDVVASVFVAVAMGVTSLATKSRILVDLGILNTRVAHVLMAGALFSDVAALVIFAAILGLAATGSLAIGGIAAAVAKALLFLIGTWIVGTRVFPVAGRWVTNRISDPSLQFLLVVLAGLSFAAAADAAGLHAILGAFLAGLFVRDGVLEHRQLRDVERRARGISLGLLAPVFFVTAGYKVSFDVFTDEPLLLAAVILLATVGKVVGTAVFYLPTGYGFREGVAVGAGMNGRGAVEIIVAEIALAAGLIDGTVFSILVFMAIFTTGTVPILLTWSIRWLRRHGELVADERSRVIVAGAGPLARLVAALMAPDGEVTLIDTNAHRAQAAAAEGFAVVVGSVLDEEILEHAGASAAASLVAITANPEVNLLAARLGSQRFGIPDTFVALPPESSVALEEMLVEFGGSLMFGRRIDTTQWDESIASGSVTELSYSVAAPEVVLADGSPLDPLDAALESLPIVIQKGAGTEPFTDDGSLGEGDTVFGIGRSAHVSLDSREPHLN
ncbi:MAG: sodium:proton exchanger [Acidimicrobiia bacterium]|nr:sodium:proton exchanger [Acidimicrobiia bacterium]